MTRSTLATLLSACLLALPSLAAHAQQPSFTQGLAQTIDAGIFECDAGQPGSRPRGRVSRVGKIRATDGTEWIVPAHTQFRTALKAADLFNECTGKMPQSSAEFDLKATPMMDAGGREEFVAYLFADNYFEFHVNGKLIAVDPVPFTPFNASVIRFKADRPVTIAVKVVDWEENLGLGSEANAGTRFHAGDAGITIHIRNAAGETVAITDGSWRAQTFYTGPLKNTACLKTRGPVRDSAACDTSDAADGARFFGAHWPIPAYWAEPGFDDAIWPMATTYTNDTVGVRGKPAFTRFPDIFDSPGADAQFIWSSNLVLDNLVLLRKVFR